MNTNRHFIRSSQIIYTFGPGAIFEGSGESFIMREPITNNWNEKFLKTIYLDRLSDSISSNDKYGAVNGFRMPIKNIEKYNDYGQLKVTRFPKWLECPNPYCGSFSPVKDELESKWKEEGLLCWRKECKDMGNQLVPTRFVAACENGHLSDVPWKEWVHHPRAGNSDQNQAQCQNDFKYYISRTSKGLGFSNTYINCYDCKARNSLAKLTMMDSLGELRTQHGDPITCDGLQPYQNSESKDNCDLIPQVIQKNSGSVWFPHTLSALDIDVDMNISDSIKENPIFLNIFKSFKDTYETLGPELGMRDDETLEKIIEDFNNKNDIKATLEDVKGFIKGENVNKNVVKNELSISDLKAQEWSTINGEDIQPTLFAVPSLITRSKKLIKNLDDEFEKLVNKKFEKVTKVEKIREVRAITGFSRLKPENKEVITKSELNWMPAVEIKGEGIFLVFEEKELNKWESQPNVINRVKNLLDYKENHPEISVPNPTPRLLLIHTFSHLLMKEISFNCGYQTSSLRERVYVSEKINNTKMSGILIYTGSTDSEGTMGGLAEQAEYPNMSQSISKTLEKNIWCSLDPICSEKYEVNENLSLASCHSCAAISETTCEYFNRCLDRSLLFDKEIGYFKELLNYQE